MKFLQKVLYLIPLYLISCTTSQVEEVFPQEEEQSAIGFNAKVQGSRAVADIDDVKTNGFSVWGGYEGGTSPVFAGMDITLGTADSYTTTQYWTYNTYNFYAVYPKGTSATYDVANNTFTINNYNVNNTQEDLLIATKTNHKYPDDGGTVNLQFGHILSKISIALAKNGANEENKVVVTSVSLSGVASSGSYTSSQWTPGSGTTTVAYNNISSELKVASVGYTKVLGVTSLSDGTEIDNGFLLIPQDIEENTLKLSVKYAFYNEDGTYAYANTAEAFVPNTTVSKWEPAKSYLYRMELQAESNNILFLTPTVGNWKTGQMGGTIIIQ